MTEGISDLILQQKGFSHFTICPYAGTPLHPIFDFVFTRFWQSILVLLQWIWAGDVAIEISKCSLDTSAKLCHSSLNQ